MRLERTRDAGSKRLACSVRAGVWFACSFVLGGCGEIFGIACTGELRSNLVVEVREAVTGAPAAWGATGLAVHEGGRRTELGGGFDSLTLFGSWEREQAGDYEVTVRKPGYRTASIRTEVDEDACHVETETVRVSLEPQSASAPETPLAFIPGPHVQGYGAGAGVQVRGDTLAIVGRAYAPCRQLVAVAFRTGNELHVQLQPSETVAMDCAGAARLQEFELRYHLPDGNTYLLITNAFGEPTVLFDGLISPATL